MAIVVADRVLETSTTSGTGTLTLAGAGSGYQSFTVGVGVGNQTYYTIYDPTALTWEVGIGTLLTGSTLSRTTVYANSSGTTALISFAANSKNVFCTSPASKYVDQSDIGTNPNQIPLNQYLGKLAFEDVLDTITGNPYYDTQISDVEPTLNLDFVNSKIVDPRISFTRSTTATYYGPNISALAEQNLLLQSQAAFNTSSWAKTNLTVGASTTAPDGTTTAQLIYPTATGASASNYQPNSFASGIYTLSIYAQAASQTYFAFLQPNNIGGGAAWFNLSAGTVGTVSGGYTATIAQVGSTTWYRCTITLTSAITGVFAFTPCDGNGSLAVTNSGISGVNFWGAQLEQRSSVTAYNVTTTTALTNYIPVLQTAPINAPRLDYSPTAGTPNGLLIEEQRTNLTTQSQTLSTWSNSNTTQTTSYNVAPDGTVTANYLVPTTASGQHSILLPSGTYATGTYTISCYMKAGGSIYGGLTLYDGTSYFAGVVFNLANGTVYTQSGGGGTATITSVGNGWYRCSVSGTGVGALSTTFSGIRVFNTAPSAVNFSYVGDGYNGIQIWGAQLEAGAFATSYIPTVASQVTRSADDASIIGTNFSSWFNAYEGVTYTETTRNANAGNYNGVFGYVVSNGYNDLYFGTLDTSYRYGISGGLQLNDNSTNITTAKIASAYTYNGTHGFSINGVFPLTSTVSVPPTNATSMVFGKISANPFYLNGYIKKIAYYPKRLSDAELQEMTS